MAVFSEDVFFGVQKSGTVNGPVGNLKTSHRHRFVEIDDKDDLFFLCQKGLMVRQVHTFKMNHRYYTYIYIYEHISHIFTYRI